MVPLSSFTNDLSSANTPAAATLAASPTQVANFQSQTPREPLISDALIQAIAARALTFPAPHTDEPVYHAPLPNARPMSAGSAHFLYNGQNNFKALISVRHLEDEMFRSVHEGLLYDSRTQTIKRVAIRALHPDKEHLRGKLDRCHGVHGRVAAAIGTSRGQPQALITDVPISFGPLWISALPLCNLLEATEGKLSNGTPPPLRQWLPWIKDVAGTLEWFHSKNVIHGKVIPENIVLMPSGTNSNTPPRARLQDFDYVMRRGYSEVGLGLEDPCSHFSIATPLTDIYGLAAALAIFFSTPERPITTEFLKAECRKYIAEFLQTGKIAIDPNAPPEYPFQKAIQYICYEQLCVIFSVLNSSEDYYEVETLDHGHRRWKCTIPNRRAATRHPQTFNSLEEVFTMYPSYPFFFTEKAIQQAEDAIVNKFRSERIPLIRPPELLKNAETLIKKREEDAEEIEGMEAILFLSRQQQPQKAAAAGGGAASTRAVSQPPQQRASILRITREEEEAYTLLFPAQQQQIHRARPTTARHVQHLPSASVISPSMAARGNFGMISSAASTTTSTQPPQRVPLLQRNLQTGTSADPYTHLGSPPRARREDTPAPGNRQQVPTVVHSATYGSFIAPASHSSSDGRPPRTLRSNTTAPGATNRQQLSQSGLGNSTRSSAFAAIRK